MTPKAPIFPPPSDERRPAVSSPEMRALLNKVIKKMEDKYPDEFDGPANEDATAAIIAWSPPGSERGLGSILLKQQPEGSLALQAYRFALQSRLEKLIEEAETDAPWLLKIVEENEPGLSVLGTPAQIAEILVENSSWLYERAGMSGLPMAAPLQNDPNALAHLQGDDDTLEAYLNALYYDGGGH